MFLSSEIGKHDDIKGKKLLFLTVLEKSNNRHSYTMKIPIKSLYKEKHLSTNYSKVELI